MAFNPPTYNNYGNSNVPPMYNNQNMYNGMPPPGYMGYNTYGGGMPIQPMSYEQMMNYRQQLIQQRDAYNKKMIEERYPVKFVIGYACFVGLLSVLAIVMQIVMIVKQSPNYYVGSGIWVGTYFLIAVSIALLVIKIRNYCLFVISFIMNFFGFMLAIGGLVIVNVIGISSSSCFYSFYSTCVATDNTYNIVLIVVGVILVISCITFIITMQCLLNGRCNGTNNIQQVNYNQNGVFMPNNLNYSNMNRQF